MYEQIIDKINNNHDVSWDELWNALNDYLSSQCCDGEVTEEEMEDILDEAQLCDDMGLVEILGNTV